MNPYSSKSYASPHNARFSTKWRTWDEPSEVVTRRDETLEVSKVTYDAHNNIIRPPAPKSDIPVKAPSSDKTLQKPGIIAFRVSGAKSDNPSIRRIQ